MYSTTPVQVVMGKENPKQKIGTPICVMDVGFLTLKTRMWIFVYCTVQYVKLPWNGWHDWQHSPS